MENAAAIEAEFLLKQFYSTLSQGVKSVNVRNYETNDFEEIIQLEVSDVKRKYLQEEESFVNQMVKENPIEKPHTKNGFSKVQALTEVQKQRSEACRKSRMNNKIKKAKSKYRHKFIASKLSSSSTLLSCIKDVIAHTESKLIRRGLDPQLLLEMKRSMGIFETPIKMEM